MIVHKYLNKYRNTLDGILVWISLAKEKDNDGNIEVGITTLFNKAKATFHSKCPGGLFKYVHDQESIYAELTTLNAKLDEEDQSRCLFSQSPTEGMNSATTDFLSQ